MMLGAWDLDEAEAAKGWQPRCNDPLCTCQKQWVHDGTVWHWNIDKDDNCPLHGLNNSTQITWKLAWWNKLNQRWHEMSGSYKNYEEAEAEMLKFHQQGFVEYRVKQITAEMKYMSNTVPLFGS